MFIFRAWCLGIGILLLAGCSDEPVSGSATSGKPLPDLELSEIYQADSYRLSDFRGKLVILNIWAPWCAPCLDEMPSLERLSKQLDPEHFVVLGITTDDRFLAQEFLRRHNISFTNFFDRDRTQVDDVLNILAFPETLIIDGQGIVIDRIRGWRDWNDPEMLARVRGYR